MKRQFQPVLTLLLALGAIALLPVRVQAQPTITPDAAVMNLDDLGVYSVGYAYRGQPEHLLALGWTGSGEERTWVSCQSAGTQNGKRLVYDLSRA